MLKLNQLRKTQIPPQLKKACNPIGSQKFGREIYKVVMNDQLFWLKVQRVGMSEFHEQSLKNEIKNYQKFSELDSAIFAPYEILNVQKHCGLDQSYIEQGLLVADCEVLFSKDPNVLKKSEIVKTLLLSLGALETMHQMSFLHGDLKTEHFRVYKQSTVLIDFEQTCAFNILAEQENTATPRYMAPELFHAEEKSVASDVYALGIIWLQWLRQEKLRAKTYLDWAKLHCQDLKINLPIHFEQFNAVLNCMLAKEKQNRCTNFYQIKQLLSENV